MGVKAQMQAMYDKQDDLIYLSYGVRAEDGASLYDYVGVAALFGTEGGRDIIGVEIMSASYWFSKGYDEDKDTWLLGDRTDNLGMITTDGDFVGYWQPYEYAPHEVPDPIGVEIKQLSKHVPRRVRKALRDAYQSRRGDFEGIRSS